MAFAFATIIAYKINTYKIFYHNFVKIIDTNTVKRMCDMRRFRVAATAAAVALAAVLCIFSASCADASLMTDDDLQKRVELNCRFDLLEVGEERRYYVEIKPAGSVDDLRFFSSDDAVATVDSNGMVIALAAGEAKITARSEKASCEDVMEIVVYDEILVADEAQNGGRSFAEAAGGDGKTSIALFGDFLEPVTIKGDVYVTGIDGARLSSVTVGEGGAFSAENVTFYSGQDIEGGVFVGKGGWFKASGCRFESDEDGPVGTAVLAEDGFTGVDVSDCEFYGFACAVDARPSDGEISVRNNIFSDSDVAVSVDVRLPGSGTNAGMTGKIEDNIFLHCVECSRFSYCGKYEGELDFEDEGIKV